MKRFSMRPVPTPSPLWYVGYFVASVLAGFLFAAGCDWKPSPVTPKPEPTAAPTTEPPESWCQAACARWEMAECKEGYPVCVEFSPDGECIHSVSCLIACEQDPHAYPTGPCVANPPPVRMQTCAEIRAACPSIIELEKDPR